MKNYLPKTFLLMVLLSNMISCQIIPEDQVPINFKKVIISVSGSGNKEKNLSSPLSSLYDGDNNTAWYQDNHTSGWIKIDLGEGRSSVVTVLKLTPAHSSWPGAGIKEFRFEGSNDDIHWDTLDTLMAKNNLKVQTFYLTNTASFRFYRIQILNSYIQHVGISEVNLLGTF